MTSVHMAMRSNLNSERLSFIVVGSFTVVLDGVAVTACTWNNIAPQGKSISSFLCPSVFVCLVFSPAKRSSTSSSSPLGKFDGICSIENV